MKVIKSNAIHSLMVKVAYQQFVTVIMIWSCLAMPGFSGLDVLKSLEAEGLLEKKNVVIFTASSDSKMLEELRKSGVKEILKKPCSIDDLAELFKRFGPNDST